MIKRRISKSISLKIIIAAVMLVIMAFFAIFSLPKAMYPIPESCRAFVEHYSELYNVDKYMIYSIIKCESNFRENAVSNAGAVGLMQVTEPTYEWALVRMGEDVKDKISLNDPETNIKFGTYIYSMLLSEFKDERTALAAYNAGRSKVIEWLKDPRYSDDCKTLKDAAYSETDDYVRKVMASYKIYSKIYS